MDSEIVRAVKSGRDLKPGADEETCPLPYAEGLRTESLLGALGTSPTLFEKINMNQYGSFNQENEDGGVSQLVSWDFTQLLLWN